MDSHVVEDDSLKKCCIGWIYGWRDEQKDGQWINKLRNGWNVGQTTEQTNKRMNE